MHINKLEIKRSVHNLASTPRSHKSLNSRRESQVRNQRSSFEQPFEAEPVNRKLGLQLKDPQLVDEMIRKRMQYFPKHENAEKQMARMPEIYRPYDVLKKAIPDNQVPTAEQFQAFKSIISNSGDPNKNFFEFNTYFYKNYQASNNGPCTTLPQILIRKVENFQDRLEQMIKEI